MVTVNIGGNATRWDFIIHIVAGAVGYNIFTFHPPGLFYCLAFTVVVQGLDMLRIHFTTKIRVLRSPSHKMEEQLENLKGPLYFYKLAQLFVMKVVFYGLVTLVSGY
ncbi:MAG: hypothetical protein ACFFDT_31685, partial [Candidatus Hodarchaeota archaeon]